MGQEFRASHRHAHIAPRKARRVMNMIRGMTAGDALDTLRNDKHRASAMIHKVLASAVANALQDEEIRANRLVISKAVIGEGGLLMGRARFRPGSQGRAMPYRRLMCHIHIHVADPGQTGGGSQTRSGGEES